VLYEAYISEHSGKNSAGKSRGKGGGKDSKGTRSRPESQVMPFVIFLFFV